MTQTPTVIVRALDSNNDPLYGNGIACFLMDLEAVAQIIKTSLLLFQGEWWNDLTVGLPVFQSIIGNAENNRQATISLLIQQVILGVNYVTGISNVQFLYTSSTRSFSYACYAQTQFGTVYVTYSPGNVAVLPLAV
jgi:hypothetical protein